MKENGYVELTAKEAIIAMLNGEELEQRIQGMTTLEVKWYEPYFMHRQIGERHWLIRPFESGFANLFRKTRKKTRPMDTFECLAWASNAESHGWLVSRKIENGKWSKWCPPQMFSYYDATDSYRRAKILPDKSGIDETTIQGFLMEIE